MISVCVLVLDVTVNYIQILTVTQLCLYGKFTSPAIMEIIGVRFWKKNYIPTNLQFLRTSHIQDALKQTTVRSCPSLDLVWPNPQ
jgi:hypothetical protein